MDGVVGAGWPSLPRAAPLLPRPALPQPRQGLPPIDGGAGAGGRLSRFDKSKPAGVFVRPMESSTRHAVRIQRQADVDRRRASDDSGAGRVAVGVVTLRY